MAQAGGRDPEKLPEALATARAAIEQRAPELMPRILALDHGSARCGCAVSDPSGTLATPLPRSSGPTPTQGLAAVAQLVAEQGAERVIVGLPLTLGGRRGRAGGRRRARSRNGSTGDCNVPVELHDERLTTRLAERTGGARGRGLARRRAPARELPRPPVGGLTRVTDGPPPVPGRRSPEEREAARRERAGAPRRRARGPCAAAHRGSAGAGYT